MDYEIKKGVYMPDSKAGRPAKYPFADMEVGDCFDSGFDGPSGHCRASIAAWQYGRKNGKKFASRMHNGTVHIWRVE